MIIADSIDKIRSIVSDWTQTGYSIGLVPTMGALHDGHLSLVKRARAENDRVITSVFVNPTQFGPNEDFDKYPRTVEQDCERLAKAGCDMVILPTPEIMYPAGFATWVRVEGPANCLEGTRRPGHFQGVATVVLKLFNLSQASNAYFGQKDFQQVQVIRQMVDDLNVNTNVIRCPIVRESDGLAMSSRNRYLSAEERQHALVLSKALRTGKQLFLAGKSTAEQVHQAMEKVIKTAPDALIDYICLAQADTLEEVPAGTLLTPKDWQDRELVALLAVKIGATRLIDNAMWTD